MTEIILLKTVLMRHYVQLPAMSGQIDGGLTLVEAHLLGLRQGGIHKNPGSETWIIQYSKQLLLFE